MKTGETRSFLIPKDHRDDSNVQPERETTNGKNNPGTDPDQDDNRVDTTNGAKEQKQ